MEIAGFLETVARLKTIKRAGWIERGVKEPESTADHGFMTAVMALVLPFSGNRDRAVKMALVHDFAEAVAGDLITKENWSGGSVTEKEKAAIERDAMKEMLRSLDAETAKVISSLWDEFIAGKTVEACFVRDIDIAERLIQAHSYHISGNFKKPLQGFWDEKAMDHIKNEYVKAFVKKIVSEGR